MAQKTEVFVSLDGVNYTKVALSKNEPIKMKYTYKDTTDLSKIFSPRSQSFILPYAENRKAFGFMGVNSIQRSVKNVFDCKIYNDGLLSLTGKLKITKITDSVYTGNFTTSQLSLSARMGDDLINDLPETSITVPWLPMHIKNYIRTLQNTPIKFFTPLVSNTRVFQNRPNASAENLDNVAYNPAADPFGFNVIKADELRPAIQFSDVIDRIIDKYDLDVEMPLSSKEYYKDLFVYCNGETQEKKTSSIAQISNDFYEKSYSAQDGTGGIGIPPSPRYVTFVNPTTSTITIAQNNTFYPNLWFGKCILTIAFHNVVALENLTNIDILVTVKRDDGLVVKSETISGEGGLMSVNIDILDEFFLAGIINFNIEVVPKQLCTWTSMELSITQSFRYQYQIEDPRGPIFGGITEVERADWIHSSQNNNNSAQIGSSHIDLYQSIPETKCTDFLASFFKTFNISVFQSDSNSSKLYWLTPKDLLEYNKPYSKKVVDYTPFVVDSSMEKEVATDYNYYNFKHKTNEYWSADNYKKQYGYEFGQLTYPDPKPAQPIPFLIETKFAILEKTLIAGTNNQPTSYGFTKEAPEVLPAGERRYKPNQKDLTIFFKNNILQILDQQIGYQSQGVTGDLETTNLNRYIEISPIHKSGFSLGFGLIQDATQQSLYFNYYAAQTLLLLNNNSFENTFKLKLPASELMLNFSNTTVGQTNIPNGFRLQNEVVILEERYTILDATIDYTTGDAELTLINIT